MGAFQVPDANILRFTDEKTGSDEESDLLRTTQVTSKSRFEPRTVYLQDLGSF